MAFAISLLLLNEYAHITHFGGNKALRILEFYFDGSMLD